jgi:hypothetical protein
LKTLNEIVLDRLVKVKAQPVGRSDEKDLKSLPAALIDTANCQPSHHWIRSLLGLLQYRFTWHGQPPFF